MKTKFFLCLTCGNMVVKVLDSGMSLSCCGRDMLELVPGETDGPVEKHMPVVECKDGGIIKVKVGAKDHPMNEDHHILFIYLETENGGQIRYLDIDKPAEAVFHIGKEKPVAVYAYCNIHGLWRAEVECEKKRGCLLTGCR